MRCNFTCPGRQYPAEDELVVLAPVCYISTMSPHQLLNLYTRGAGRRNLHPGGQEHQIDPDGPFRLPSEPAVDC